MIGNRLLVIAVILLLTASVTILEADALTPIEELGEFLFFDENLSTPPGQSCAACHAPEVGFTGPDSVINNTTAVYPGVVVTSGVCFG